jgi:hypothetical protein
MKRLTVVLTAILMVVGCAGRQAKTAVTADSRNEDKAKVEVLYFHGRQRCITCRSIERLAREVVETEFPHEVSEGKLGLRVVDFSTDEGKLLADEFEVAWSSLFVVRGDVAENLTEMGFKYAKTQPVEFKKQLSAKIKNSLR